MMQFRYDITIELDISVLSQAEDCSVKAILVQSKHKLFTLFAFPIHYLEIVQRPEK